MIPLFCKALRLRKKFRLYDLNYNFFWLCIENWIISIIISNVQQYLRKCQTVLVILFGRERWYQCSTRLNQSHSQWHPSTWLWSILTSGIFGKVRRCLGSLVRKFCVFYGFVESFLIFLVDWLIECQFVHGYVLGASGHYGRR